MKVRNRRRTDTPLSALPSETRVMVRTARRANLVQTVLTAALLIALLLVGAAGVLLWNRADRQGVAITQLVSSLAATCDQTDTAKLSSGVQEDCARSQAGQSPTVVQGVPGTPGAQGDTGATGATGQTGANGTAGPQGVPGTAGASPACLDTPTACQGATGPLGPTGAQGGTGPAGTNGVNGTDGTNGAAGSPGEAGPLGPVGPPGADGKDGAAGADGQPPQGWTVTQADGGTQTCSRVGDFDANAPRYTCTASSNGGPAAG